MSETPRSEQPEDLEKVAERTIDNWKKELPKQISGWWGKKEGELASPEEIFRGYDKYLSNHRKDKKRAEAIEKDVLEREEDATNNFYNCFSPEAAENMKNGKMEMFGIIPFYINARFDGLWNKMCEQLPEDVKKAIESFRTRHVRERTREEDESLNKLALYLNENEDIPVSFLHQ